MLEKIRELENELANLKQPEKELADVDNDTQPPEIEWSPDFPAWIPNPWWPRATYCYSSFAGWLFTKVKLQKPFDAPKLIEVLEIDAGNKVYFHVEHPTTRGLVYTYLHKSDLMPEEYKQEIDKFIREGPVKGNNLWKKV